MDAIPRRHDDQSAWSSSAKLAAAAAAAVEIYDTLMYRRPTFIGRTQWQICWILSEKRRENQENDKLADKQD